MPHYEIDPEIVIETLRTANRCAAALDLNQPNQSMSEDPQRMMEKVRSLVTNLATDPKSNVYARKSSEKMLAFLLSDKNEDGGPMTSHFDVISKYHIVACSIADMIRPQYDALRAQASNPRPGR